MSKKSDDTYEPIKLDTTILKIDIKTNGDLITKEYDLIPFHPNMSDMKDLSNNNYISQLIMKNKELIIHRKI